MSPFFIVEAEIATDLYCRLLWRSIRLQVYFFVFDAAPEPFNKDIIDPVALANLDLMGLKNVPTPMRKEHFLLITQDDDETKSLAHL